MVSDEDDDTRVNDEFYEEVKKAGQAKRSRSGQAPQDRRERRTSWGTVHSRGSRGDIGRLG